MKKLYIISNESIFNDEKNFYCDNLDIKSTPEGLSKTFDVTLIARSSKKKRFHKINLNNIKKKNNIFSYLFELFKSLKNDESYYLIFSLTPYTFLAAIFIKLFKKKPIIYLRSDGYREYRVILGFFGTIIYHSMFFIASKISFFISVRKYILKGKPGKTVLPSQINSNWFNHLKKIDLSKIRLLYVGRLKKEKGIFSLIEILKRFKKEINLSIVGAEDNFDISNYPKNIKVFHIENNEINLIKYYDDHNIFILPSYTEGHPMVLLEALARLRPVIIFKDIEHIIEDKKGIFIAERNPDSLNKKIQFIKNNYESIQNEMRKNKIPTKEEFLKKLASIILNTN